MRSMVEGARLKLRVWGLPLQRVPRSPSPYG